jgi:hypothetical protein
MQPLESSGLFDIMAAATCEGRSMPTTEELKEEETRLRQLRFAVGLAMSTISQTRVSLEEASQLVAATRRLALRLFPGKEFAFDLIYLPRLRRLLVERFGSVRNGLFHRQSDG